MSKLLFSTLLSVFLFGSTKTNEFLDERIVGGKNTTIEEHPYQLVILRDNQVSCGAIVLTTTTALTAAHCVDEKVVGLSVRAGSTLSSSGGQVVNVSKALIHPKYNSTTVDYDVAILTLENALVFGVSVDGIGLQEIGEEVALGAFCTLSGWGVINTTGVQTTEFLQTVDVPKVSDGYCRYAYESGITDRMLCFGYQEDGKDSCQNDSGGPLVCKGKLAGIISFGRGCGEAGYPGIYAKISHKEIHNFITTNM